MFKTTITQTPLTSDIANSFFQNISGDSYKSDVSFLATLRALLAPRINAEDKICLQFTSSSYRASQLNGIPVRDIVEAVTRDMRLHDTGMFIIHDFCAKELEDNIANLKAVENGFAECNAGYYLLQKMTVFFKKSFPVVCFVNPETKNVVIFTNNISIKKLHYLEMSVLPAMPWYFDPSKNGISDIEMRLIQSLKETTPDEYLKCINEIAAQYDFRTVRIRQKLQGFESRFERIECDKIRTKISQTDAEIQRLNDAIGSYYIQRNEQCIKLLGLEQKIAQGGDESEIMEYFLCNNKLYLEEVTDTELYFCVADYLSYFDKEMVELVLSNKRSFVYEYARGPIAPEKMVKLIRAIFIDESLHIKFCAAYRFNLNGNVAALTDHSFPEEFINYMPNTHINNYHCMGGYEQTINRLLKDNNYIGAIEQCVASCKNLNWGDSIVMGKFMSYLYSTNKNWIELPDGSFVKPAAAIKWLEEQEAANGEKEQEETSHE